MPRKTAKTNYESIGAKLVSIRTKDQEIAFGDYVDSLGLNGTIKFFTVNKKLAEMAALASKDLTRAKKLPPVGLDLMQEFIWFRSPMPNQLS